MTPNEFAEYLLSKNNGDALQALYEACENIAWLNRYCVSSGYIRRNPQPPADQARG